jgi:O-antigen/teichoic acid export membrane protein
MISYFSPKKYIEFLKFLFNKRGSRTKSVIRGSFSILGSSILGNLTRLGLVMILTRYYTKEEFGIWATINATASLISYGDFGIINALRNKLSKLITMGEVGLKDAKDYFFSSLIFFTFFSIVISLIIIICSQFIPFELLFKTENQILKSQGVYILLWIQFLFFINIPLSMGVVSFFSFQESELNAFFAAAQYIVSFLVVIIMTILKYSIVDISICYFIPGTIINGIGTFYFLKRRSWFNYTFKLKKMFNHIKDLLSTGIKFMGLQISNSFLQNAGTILASSFLGLTIAAEFNMVQKLYAFLTGIYQSILNPIWGGYAEASAKNDWRWCKKTLNVTLFLSTILFAGAIIVFYFFGNFFLYFLAGKGYISQPFLFIFLGLTYLFIVIFSTSTILQSATNKIDLLVFSLILGSVLIFPLSNFLIKGWGIIGIAIATSVIWLILAILLTFQSYSIINKFHKNFNK